MFNLVAMFGGFLSLLRDIFSNLLKPTQSFKQTNSIAKKLYTVRKSEEAQSKDLDPDKLRDNISKRTILTLSYSKHVLFEILSSKLFCCCRMKPREEDELFNQAQSKMNRELDILHIIKQLRNSYFVSQQFLEPHQILLIKFFNCYTLSQSKN